MTQRVSRVGRLASPPAIELLESRQMLSSTLNVAIVGEIPQAVIYGQKGAPVLALGSPFKGIGIGSEPSHSYGVNVINRGPDRVNGPYDIAVFASPDGTVADASQLAMVTRHLQISNGGDKTIQVPIPRYPTNLDGQYSILAEVTGPSVANVGVSSTTVSISPKHVDLSNLGVTVPSSIYVRQVLSVKLDVSNLGNVVALGKLTTLLEMSSSATGANPVQFADANAHIRIAPGSSETVKLRVPEALSAFGSHFIVAVLDPNNTFDDTDAANNSAVSETALTVTVRPHLISVYPRM